MSNLKPELDNLAVQVGLTPIDNYGMFRGVQDECYMDFRAVLDSKPGYVSTFEGLDFDSDNIRTQSFTVIDEMPVAVMTLVTIPKKIVASQRYFKVNPDNTEVWLLDYKGMVEVDDLPNFLIVPGWTFIKPEIRNTMALKGYHFMKNIIDATIKLAPEGTWIEAVAQSYGNRYKYDVTKLEVGCVYVQDDLAFPISEIGINQPGSTSSVKFANHLGLSKVENVGSARSLGPVFLRRVK